MNQLESSVVGYRVPLARVDKELTKFWLNEAGEHDEPVTRTSTMNFIILTADRESLERCNDIIPRISLHHPSRVILVYIDPQDETREITSFVSGNCQVSMHGNKQICCEHITLLTGIGGSANLSGAILPLLLPELPVFLWCPDVLLFKRLPQSEFIGVVDRLILALPGRMQALPDFMDWLEDIVVLSKDVRISDITWSQLTNWREAIAQFFDDEEREHDLLNIGQVRIETGEPISTFAFLVAAWLATLLDWRLERYEAHATGQVFSFKNSTGSDVSVNIVAGEADPLLAGIKRVRIACAETSVFEAAVDNSTEISMLVKKGRHEQRHKMELKLPQMAQLLCDELDYLKADSIYLRTIATTRQMVEAAL